MAPAGIARAQRFWRDHAILLITLAAFALIMLGFIGLTVYGGLAADRLAETRESALLQRALDRKLSKVLEDVTSATIWNDAYDKSERPTDAAWLDINFGQYFHQYLKHDLTVAFGPGDKPFYASRKGVRVHAEQLQPFVAAVQPLLQEVRAREARRLALAPRSLGFDRLVSAGAAVRVGDELYLVQAATVVPEPGYKGRLVDPQPVVASAVRLSAPVLSGLAADYRLRDLRLTSTPPTNRPWAALRARDGSIAGAVGWTPERPGIGVYKRAKGTILLAGLLLAALLASLVMRTARLARDLRRAREDADAANLAKSEFLANISHEIRTPLNGVLGMAQAMAADALSPAQRERLDVVRASGASLLGLLNDVLDLSKIQAGKLEIEHTGFDLHELCDGVCATFRGLAEAKDIALDCEIEDALPRGWTGDPLRLRQVLSNLVSNAVKFTGAGRVRLSVSRSSSGVVFCVSDTGIGMGEAELARLFEKFSQADASTTRRYGGSGLGLAICHELTRLLQGDLTVSSRAGEGSEFRFTAPLVVGPERLAPTATNPGRVAVAPVGRALRILAAEDNATNQLVLRALLDPLEMDLRLVGNGLEAVAAFEADDFDLILMDVQMPEMNGLDATREIRRREAELGRTRIPIVSLSANVMTHQVTEYAAAGMNAHLGKPIEVEKLYAILEAAAAGTLGPAAAAKSAA
jgi:signal transduction histidine kinase/ActR/RegA family two-component response regulator